MELTYSNEMGTLKLYGSGGHNFTVCDIEGLDLQEKSRVVKSYVGEDGNHEESSRYGARVISISGDIKYDDEYMKKIHNAARVLSRKGELLIKNGKKERLITVNSASLTMGKAYGIYRTFVIQMTCDYPHFTDIAPITSAVFKKENHLTSTSSLPIMLTERIADGIVNNTGDLKIYPIITIIKNADFDTKNSITVTNETTGGSVVLNKTMAKNEEITINVYDRTIKSNVDGNIMGTLSQYSSLADLWCDCGENYLSVALDGVQKGIEVWVTYNNEYLEAI